MQTEYKIANYVYDPSKPIGRGQYGIVYKGINMSKDENEPRVVALKTIDRKRVKSDDIIIKDIETMERIKGRFVIEFYDCYKTNDFYYIVMEFFDGTNMEERIKRGKPLDIESAKKVLKQICCAFLEIEKEAGAIMHRDIKPENILEDSDGNIKVVDFGFAKIIDQVDEYVKNEHTTGKGTPYYMSPQILAEEEYSCKTDIWSAGVTIFELIFCKVPWDANSPKELLQNIRSQPLKFPSNVKLDDEFKDLLKSMLKIDEEHRLSWKEVYEHPALEYTDE